MAEKKQNKMDDVIEKIKEQIKENITIKYKFDIGGQDIYEVEYKHRRMIPLSGASSSEERREILTQAKEVVTLTVMEDLAIKDKR